MIKEEKEKNTENTYIGISKNRMKHMLGVARKAYSIAKEIGHEEKFARKCFMLGWLHDVGYEFSKVPEEHGAVGAKLVFDLVNGNILNDMYSATYFAIKQHGQYPSARTEELRILNMADMQVNSRGEEVTVQERLEEIKKRYGENSVQYRGAYNVCCQLGMLETEEAASRKENDAVS